jgi:hypothetical protein
MEHQFAKKSTQKEQLEQAFSMQATFPARVTLHPVLRLQRMVGNQAVHNMLRVGGVGLQNREHETVIQAFANIRLFLPVQRKAVLLSPLQEESQLQSRIQAARSNGRRLDQQVQQRLEQGTGLDLSNVRVHTDTEADRLSRAVNAMAFTTGSDIFFRSGTYNPHAMQGYHTLAHEVTHVVQQAAGPVSATHTIAGISISDHNDRFEQAAEANAARLAALPGEKNATPRPKQPAPIHRSAASQPRVLQRLVFLAGDISKVHDYFLQNDLIEIIAKGDLVKIQELVAMLSLQSSIDWSLKRAGGPLQDVFSINLSSLKMNETFYINEHGNVGTIGSTHFSYDGLLLALMLITRGKLPTGFEGTIMIMSCFAGATNPAHTESLVEEVAEYLKLDGRHNITVTGATGKTLITPGANLGALSTGFQVEEYPKFSKYIKAKMIKELLAELEESEYKKGPPWWPTVPSDIYDFEKNAKRTELEKARRRAAKEGTSEETEFVTGLAEKSSEMFSKIQQAYLEKISPLLYTEERVNEAIKTVRI